MLFSNANWPPLKPFKDGRYLYGIGIFTGSFEFLPRCLELRRSLLKNVEKLVIVCLKLVKQSPGALVKFLVFGFLFLSSLSSLAEGKASFVAKSGHGFRVSVVSEEQVQNLFQKVAMNPDIPSRYLKDGCYAVAHKITQLLEEEGIVAGKIHLLGDLRYQSPAAVVKWEFHVAAYVVVEKKQGPGGFSQEVYVLDPATAVMAVPMAVWQESVTTLPGARVDEFYYTKRFNYLPPDDGFDMKAYDEADQENMNRTLRDYSEALKQRANSTN